MKGYFFNITDVEKNEPPALALAIGQTLLVTRPDNYAEVRELNPSIRKTLEEGGVERTQVVIPEEMLCQLSVYENYRQATKTAALSLSENIEEFLKKRPTPVCTNLS